MLVIARTRTQIGAFAWAKGVRCLRSVRLWVGIAGCAVGSGVVERGNIGRLVCRLGGVWRRRKMVWLKTPHEEEHRQQLHCLRSVWVAFPG